MKRKRISLDQKKKAVQIALEDKSPLKYLENLGCADPAQAWYRIKLDLKEADPETYAKLPAKIQRKDTVKKEPSPTLSDAMEGMQEAANDFFSACEDMGLNVHKADAPEEQKVTTVPEKEAGLNFRIRSVQTDLGTYSADDEYFEFKTADRKDAIELEVNDFVRLAKELPKVMKLLGVEV